MKNNDLSGQKCKCGKKLFLVSKSSIFAIVSIHNTSEYSLSFLLALEAGRLLDFVVEKPVLKMYNIHIIQRLIETVSEYES